MALAGAGLADDQGVAALGDELQGVQVEAGLARQLRVKAPVEVLQSQPLVEAGLLAAPLVEPGATPVQFVLQDRSEGFQERLLAGLGLHEAGFERGVDAGQTRFFRRESSVRHDWGRFLPLAIRPRWQQAGCQM